MVIFDEAHNIEQQCEDAASVVISSLDLAGCLEDITQVMQWMVKSHSAANESELVIEEKEQTDVDPNGDQQLVSISNIVDLRFRVDIDTRSSV